MTKKIDANHVFSGYAMLQRYAQSTMRKRSSICQKEALFDRLDSFTRLYDDLKNARFGQDKKLSMSRLLLHILLFSQKMYKKPHTAGGRFSFSTTNTAIMLAWRKYEISTYL